MFLPDINVWLALAFEGHPHHDTANEWFEQVPDGECSFCRITQQGFLRLSTNPKAFGKEAVSLANAWVQYDLFLSDPRVVFTEEPAGLEAHWRAYTQRRSFAPDIWSDAYLASFVVAADMQLVTFDRGFSKFKGLNCLILR
jgi:uncharacterized protein